MLVPVIEGSAIVKLDELPEDEQERASYCVSCGEVRPEEQMEQCPLCEGYICSLDGCKGGCECDDELRFLEYDWP